MSQLTAQEKHESLRTYWSSVGFVNPATLVFDANGNTVPPGSKYHYMNKAWDKLTASDKEFYG